MRKDSERENVRVNLGNYADFGLTCLNNMEYFLRCESNFLFNISISVRILLFKNPSEFPMK